VRPFHRCDHVAKAPVRFRNGNSISLLSNFEKPPIDAPSPHLAVFWPSSCRRTTFDGIQSRRSMSPIVTHALDDLALTIDGADVTARARMTSTISGSVSVQSLPCRVG